ncbi:MAG: hypothetical protein ACLRM8_06325 [Alistipes sp.]
MNDLKPWEHTLDELRAGASSQRRAAADVGGVYRRGAPCRNDAALARRETDRGGRRDLNTAESVKACSRACEIIREKKAQHFCEFIVSGNAAIWAGCYSAAQLAGIKVGWMSYSAPSAISPISIRGRTSTTRTSLPAAPVSNPKHPLQSYLDAGVALSVYNADTDPEMTYVLKYYPKMKAVCTNYPAKLLGRIGRRGCSASHPNFYGSLYDRK